MSTPEVFTGRETDPDTGIIVDHDGHVILMPDAETKLPDKMKQFPYNNYWIFTLVLKGSVFGETRWEAALGDAIDEAEGLRADVDVDK